VRVLGRLLAVLLVVVVVAVMAAGGLLAWVGARALPQTTGTLHVAGLGAPVTVYRDTAGVAQIVADSPDDLFFAQGYVHASERMWQMEVFRHVGSGRLAELFGKSQVDTDRFIRTLGWRQAAERDLAAAPADVRRALDRYAAGGPARAGPVRRGRQRLDRRAAGQDAARVRGRRPPVGRRQWVGRLHAGALGARRLRGLRESAGVEPGWEP